MDRGWADWAQQAAELHTYWANQENRKKEGKGFYKLDEESIATVREDLVKDYQALIHHHAEEIVQLLDNFGMSQV